MRISFLFVFTLLSTSLFSQYSTPGTGVIWNLDSLVVNSDGAVTFEFDTSYEVNTELHVSANDSLNIDGKIIAVAGGVIIYIEGSINMDGNSSTIYSSSIDLFGIVLEENSIGFFRNVNFSFFGGLKVLTPNFHMEGCLLTEHSPSYTSEGAVEISIGKPVFLNNSFTHNDISAISTAANSQVAPRIEGNLFYYNVNSNTISAQINLGPTGASDTTVIIGNNINGFPFNEMSGGITFSTLLGGVGNVIIQDNIIKDNRYAIDIIGNNLYALINNNAILGNNFENDPYPEGSGINLSGNSTSFAIISNNEIRHNLWGVTLQGAFLANLGDDVDNIDSPGLNVFAENGINGQLQAFWNNTPNDVPAKFNCWNDTIEPLTLEIAESVIKHVVDDPQLGEVFFDPLGECAPVGVNEGIELDLLINLFPNPARESITLEWPSEFNFETLTVLSSTGQMISEFYSLKKNKMVIDVKGFSSGIYHLIFQSKNEIITKKFVRS